MQLLLKDNAHVMVQPCACSVLQDNISERDLDYRRRVGEASGMVPSWPWDNWLQTLAEIATYVERALLCLLVIFPNYAWHFLTTQAYYMRPRLLIMLSCMRHTLCRCTFLVIVITYAAKGVVYWIWKWEVKLTTYKLNQLCAYVHILSLSLCTFPNVGLKCAFVSR